MSKNKSGESAVPFICFLFGFLLSLAFVFSAASVIARVALDEQVISSIVHKDAYCSTILETIENKAYDYTIPTGIDTDVPKGIFEKEEIARDLSDTVHNAFTKSTQAPNTLALQERVMSKALDYYRQTGEISEGTDAVVKAYSEDIAEIYSNSIKVIGLDYVCLAAGYYARLFPVILLVLLLAILFLSWILVKMQDYPHRGLRYVSYASGAAALLLFIGPFAFYQSKIYTRINISYYPLYYLTTTYIESILKMCFIASLFFFVSTCIIIYIIAKKKRRLLL